MKVEVFTTNSLDDNALILLDAKIMNWRSGLMIKKMPLGSVKILGMVSLQRGDELVVRIYYED